MTDDVEILKLVRFTRQLVDGAGEIVCTEVGYTDVWTPLQTFAMGDNRPDFDQAIQGIELPFKLQLYVEDTDKMVWEFVYKEGPL
jgi:hypothetical protein